MSELKKFFHRDNFFFGALMGFIIPAVVFVIIRYMAYLSGSDKFILRMPGHDIYQVLGIMCNLFPFRYYMINRKMDNTGRGLLFSTIILVMLYFVVAPKE